MGLHLYLGGMARLSAQSGAIWKRGGGTGLMVTLTVPTTMPDSYVALGDECAELHQADQLPRVNSSFTTGAAP